MEREEVDHKYVVEKLDDSKKMSDFRRIGEVFQPRWVSLPQFQTPAPFDLHLGQDAQNSSCRRGRDVGELSGSNPSASNPSIARRKQLE